MSLTKLSTNDLDRLQQSRLERFSHFFTSSLLLCQIQVDTSKHTLAIDCPHSQIVDELLCDFEDLCRYAWLILGVRAIVLYFCEEEILRTDTYS